MVHSDLPSTSLDQTLLSIMCIVVRVPRRIGRKPPNGKISLLVLGGNVGGNALVGPFFLRAKSLGGLGGNLGGNLGGKNAES